MARIHCYLLLVFVLFIVDPFWVKAVYTRRSLVNSTVNIPVSNQDQAQLPSKEARNQSTDPTTYHERFQQEVNEKHIEEHMRYLYSQVHLTGPTRGLESAEYLARKWREYGFDGVEIPEYDILASQPQPSKPNMITIENYGNIEYTIEGKIKLYPDPTKNDTVDFYPFVGYSPNKTVQGDLVYVNYGKEDDYRELLKRNISVEGKIVLARSQPDVYLASRKGAIGLISFPDVEFYATEGTSDDKTYPNAKWLSKDAVQMWAAYGDIRYYGDVATPGEASYIDRDGIPMWKLRTVLPNIPAQPISYGQAKQLLQRLKGEEVPESWQIPGFNMTLRMGPGFQTPGSKVKLQVNTQLARTPIYNVIGTIRGTTDKTVIVGSQRDSWAFGAVEALSGTATINEIARVLGRLLKSGWRPRRTIKICSWGGENWRLAGSTEWAEDTLSEDRVKSNIVGYINLDMVASGRFALRARGSPLFKNLTLNWAKKIKDPINPTKTMYDAWLEKNPPLSSLPDGLELQVFSTSNYKTFYDYLGIPSADFAYLDGDKMTYDKYPVYHTTEDTLYWMQKFVDPDFKIHKAMTQFSGGMILDLVDSPLIPYRLQDLTDVISKSCSVLGNSQPKNKEFGLNKDDLNKLWENARFLNKCAEKIDKEKMKFTSVQINDIMRNAEKPFLVQAGLFYRRYDRHVVFNFGFTNFNSYRNAFPAVAQAIVRANNMGSKSEVKKQLMQLADRVYSAIWKWKCYTF